MADHWMQDAFSKHPGLETRKAKSAGESTQKFAQEHEHDSGKSGQRARLALLGAKISRGRKRGYVAGHER